MAFEHACFVSYRHHDPSELQKRFVEDLCTAIRNELTLLIDDSRLFIDRERLEGGALFNRTLAKALCHSVCMIAIYTPNYFSSKNTYCAREYRAMERLEAGRLARMRHMTAQDKGLIIPVVLRGGNNLPEHIKSHRHYYSFEPFLLTSSRISKHKDFAPLAKKIAEVIADRHELFSHMADELTCDCEHFDIPAESEVLPWLAQHKSNVAQFPFRSAS